ncbi:MAG TPA: response regulator [candidate division Zixibacteria bacterium]|nr:response regulator [candidate division Zixibacteria bacterium]
MPRILIVDDDPDFYFLLQTVLGKRGYELIRAENGNEALSKIKAEQPDAVIMDKVMPGMSGFDVARKIRQDAAFAHLPILIVSGAARLDDKLAAFSAGADDYLTKPFEIDELAARITALVRKSEALKSAQTQVQKPVENATLIAVHSLRGGIGSSSVAVNLSLALTELWQKPTILIDMVMVYGQIALMLNKSLKRTWGDITSIGKTDIDDDALNGIISSHDSGLRFLAAPKNPIEAEEVSPELLRQALDLLQPRFDYIVADLPHDFSNNTLEILETADSILVLLAPDLVSVRAAAINLNTYKSLGFDEEKVYFVLNQTQAKIDMTPRQIEDALHHPISLVIPHSPRLFTEAINTGLPFLLTRPESEVSTLIIDLAFRLSKETHQNIPPPAPSDTWRKAVKRMKLFGANGRKGDVRGIRKWLK